MITIKEESTINSIYQYLKKNESNNKEFNRYCKSLVERAIKENNISFLNLINHILIKEFKCDENYLNSIFVNIKNKIKYEKDKYNIFFIPIFIKNKNNKDSFILNKNLLTKTKESFIFDSPFILNESFFKNYLNINDSLIEKSSNNRYVTFNNNIKNNNYLIPILTKNNFENDSIIINNENFYLSTGKLISYDLLKLNNIYFDFFLKEELKFSIFNIMDEIPDEFLKMEIKTDSNYNKIDIYFYNENLNKTYPINIIETNYESYEEMIFILDFIDQTLKNKNIKFSIL